MRILIALLFLAYAFPAYAQKEENLSDQGVVSEESASAESADGASIKPPPPKAKGGVPLDGLWRSDSALIEAERMLTDKKYVDAMSLLDQVIARNPRNADAHVDMAMAWLNVGNKDKAKQSITNALVIDKNHLGAYVISGLVSLMEKDTQQAEYHLSALRILCRNTTCPEYQTLQRIIRESNIAQ